ncbi:MAG: succinate-semialdehyde dehydrogenase/glutarate-semialdehyde dehydrogenase [Pseudohongiellaceae bacterium]
MEIPVMSSPAAVEPRASIENRNPATGELIELIPCANAAEVTQAVARSRGALAGWAAMGLSGRLEVLERVAKRFEDPALIESLAQLITDEMGKPVSNSRREAAAMAPGLRRLASSAAEALATVDTREGDSITRLSREPVGIVAAITPWNFPLAMAREVIVPALVAGNTVVFKPSELVPLCGAAMFAEFAAELPADVMVLTQGNEATGKALVSADIDMVGFVGSVSAGQHIMAACASGLKRLVLELGGKDPMVVCADADLEAAADFAVKESLRNSGQVCCSVERVYVESSAAERFTELVVERAKAITAGNGHEDVFMGPMASVAQRDHVAAQVEDAKSRGAKVPVGGAVRPGPGLFYEPTVVCEADESMAIMNEETFGPVVTLRTVASGDQAVELANDSPFGLGASVWCGDHDRAMSLAAKLEVGQVGVNRGLGGAGDPPWAGVKHSGFGFLGSPDGYRMFSRPLSLSWNDPA